MENFKIQYLGGIGRVTGSCTLVEKAGTTFLIDCGMVQGEAHSDYENGQKFPFDPDNIKFIILTHAHLDHCGLIPRLVNEGFNGKIYCTTATKKLTIEILKDSANITELYSRTTVDKLKFDCVDTRENFKWGRLLPIDNNLMLGLYRSAHILGSTSVVIGNTVSKDTVWFSGDVGRNCREDMSQPLLKYRQSPDLRNTLVVCESTYGARSESLPSSGFEERQAYYSQLLHETLVEKSGSLVIPAFSLQRTQDILTDLFLLFNQQPDLCGGVTVVCDSPLARRISKIYAEEFFKYKDKDGERNYHYVNPELISQLSRVGKDGLDQLQSLFFSDSTKIGNHTIQFDKPGITEKGPIVYLSSAGMCSAGPVVNHLLRCLPDKKNTVLLTGYQAKATVGNTLTSIMYGNVVADKPLFPDSKNELKPSTVCADIKSISFYSGHADKEGLLNYLFNTDRQYSPPVIHLNHGDDAARSALIKSINERYEQLDAESPGAYQKPKVKAPKVQATYRIKNGTVKKTKPIANRSSEDHKKIDKLKAKVRVLKSMVKDK